MVVKRNKVPKRSKRIRGGVGFFDLFDGLKSVIDDRVEDLNIKLTNIDKGTQETIKQWVNFINILRDYIFQQKCTGEDVCAIEENMSEIDIAKALANLKANFEVKAFGDNEHEKRIVPINKNKLTKSISVLGDAQLIDYFDKTFLSILNKVNNYVVNNVDQNESKQFKNMMYIVSNLPNIKKSLPKLVNSEITNFNGRYKKILDLLKAECSGIFSQPLCSAAAGVIGNDVSELYTKLKANADITEFVITDEVLIEFIKGVLPIMIPKLSGINEFEDDVFKLNGIAGALGLKSMITTQQSSTGGKKSSRATYKEILGKQMKIYTKPNDKKEYVKHKGYLISIREYKEHMKHMKHGATGGAATGGPTTKKVILGKERCIYKVQGSKQDHIKYKGSLITVSDYKNLMKTNR